MRRRKSRKERDMRLTDFSGLREMVIAHNAMLHSKQPSFETDDGYDQSLSVYFAG